MAAPEILDEHLLKTKPVYTPKYWPYLIYILLILLGFIFKILHWPGGKSLIACGISFSIGLLIAQFVFSVFKKKKSINMVLGSMAAILIWISISKFEFSNNIYIFISYISFLCVFINLLVMNIRFQKI